MKNRDERATSSPGRAESDRDCGPDTAACVRLLRDPTTYGEGVDRVEVKETSKSWVFLTPNEVYKLKKPIKNHFQDLTTITAREANCRAEVRLNRRLAPSVYLGVLPVTRRTDALAVAGDGPVIDWLVRMRRLPNDRMLDRIVLDGEARTDTTRSRLDSLAECLIRFYEAAPIAALTPQEYVSFFKQEQATNRLVLKDARFAHDLAPVDFILARFDSAFDTVKDQLETRVQERRIVDGHGDLRPEHVCLVDPPVVIDCLEFSERLRMVDPFDELVFLGLECELIGAAEIRLRLIDQCATGLGDRPPQSVLLFYEAYRAFLRARQSLAHLLAPQPRLPAKWIPKARAYLAIAERALITL
jgi:aminoglycoside phosphotransferase family enzyme